MPAKISIPETEEFRLELLDERQGVPEAEKTIVVIKQATVRQNSQRSRLFSEYIRELADRHGGKERVIFRLPLYDLITEEVFLALVGCNLMNGDKPLFKFSTGPQGAFLDMTRNQFEDAWGMLDDDTAAEIHSKVLQVNFHWVMGTEGDLNQGE